MDAAKKKHHLPTRAEDFSAWYNELVILADLADYAPVKGCMVIKPYGYAIWENIQSILDAKIKATGHVNAYFPLLIPEEFLQREKKHVEGFSPELAVVTHGGGKELAEKLVIRPTSETIMYDMYAKWVQSYRDLPIMINQWANVVRWEMRTRLFLRTLEFLWQEGHTAHATEDEARTESRAMIDMYREFAEQSLAIPVIPGEKSENERFAGATNTYTIEAMMQDGKALQAGTSHELGQNFAKSFNIKYLDRDGQQKHVWQTSWGVSTRLIGAIVMAHGDDHGLVLPPDIAPYHVVMVTVGTADAAAHDLVMAKVAELRQQMGELRVHVDSRDVSPGWKFTEWELKGVPLRIEIGPRDIQAGTVVLVRRDTREKLTVQMTDLGATIAQEIASYRERLFARAKQFRDEHTQVVTTYEQLAAQVQTGFAIALWCGSGECEAKVKAEHGATTRCMPFDRQGSSGACVVCGAAADRSVIFAKAY
jgi:prolyl-tRNA synthetase